MGPSGPDAMGPERALRDPHRLLLGRPDRAGPHPRLGTGLWWLGLQLRDAHTARRHLCQQLRRRAVALGGGRGRRVAAGLPALGRPCPDQPPPTGAPAPPPPPPPSPPPPSPPPPH